ncbi:MAG: type II toxin-antitoxin system RelE/ParE family toxin [Armatimonadota bacterium]
MASRYRLVYYEAEGGRQPVAEWFDSRPVAQQAKLAWALSRLGESGYLLGPPWLKKLDDDIWELRVESGGNQLRVLFYERERHVLVLLLAFAKKTRRTPKRKLDTARAHLMADWERHRKRQR